MTQPTTAADAIKGAIKRQADTIAAAKQLAVDLAAERAKAALAADNASTV